MQIEQNSSIRNYRQWNPIPAHNLINVESHIILGLVSRLHMDKGGRLYHPVHHNTYKSILSPSPLNTNHEVHVYGFLIESQNLKHIIELLLHVIPPIDLI